MFRTIRRIIRWCGNFKKRLYISFFSFLSGLSAAYIPVNHWKGCAVESWRLQCNVRTLAAESGYDVCYNSAVVSARLYESKVLGNYKL